MLILSVKPVCVDSSTLIEYILSQHKEIPMLFDNGCFFAIEVFDVKNEELYPRLLFEDVYLNRDMQYCSTPNKIMISLSEALLFIKRAVPPHLQHLIPESTNSIDSVANTLKDLLMMDGEDTSIQISMLKEIINMQPFKNVEDTVFNDETLLRKIDLFKDVNETTAFLYIYFSYTGEFTEPVIIVLNMNKGDDVEPDILYNKSTFRSSRIVSVKTDGDKMHAMVVVDSEHNNSLIDFAKNSYKKLEK